MKKKLSVIIPVYNTSKYIEKCLNSIVNQQIDNIEIIIINDGSTDNSDEIIKNWVNQNQDKTQIKYFIKENDGLSDSRNLGVKQATGDYLTFVDSDDYLAENLYRNLEKYMNQEIDLIKFKMQTVDESENVIEKIEGPVFEKCTGEEGFKKLCTIDKFIDPACLYLYKKEFFIKNNFQYKKGTYHEDFGLTPLIIIKAKSFVSTNEFGYYYLQSNNSITRNDNKEKSIKKAKDVLEHYDNMILNIEKGEINKKTRDLVKRYYTNMVILKARELISEKEEYEKYIKEIKKRKMYRNIKPYNVKQLIKRIIIKINVKLYLKIKGDDND